MKKNRQNPRNFDSNRLSASRSPNEIIPGCREDPKPCHRGFIIPERLEAARRPLCDRISIERFAVSSGGGRDESNVSASGAEKLNSLPSLRRLSLASSCIPLIPFSLSFSSSLPPPHSLSTVVIHLCVLPISSTLGGTPLFLCRLCCRRRAFSINCR